MTNEEAKVFLDNLKICINEHPVVADWLVEIADRKTEPNSSEIPNNYCDDCLYTDTCDDKAFFYACTSKATISKMEQVDKDINVRSKDEPQTNADQRIQSVESVETMSCQECKHWIYDDRRGWFCPLKSQDECRCEPKDEPQTDCAWR